MLNIFLFLSFSFIFILLVGWLIEKIRIPWIFAGLILGAFLAIYNPFSSITSSSSFLFLANLGMYFLLFVIGFELDLGELFKTSRFILRSTFFIIPFEAIFGSLIVHFVFGYGWFISVVVALSFATVGEAVLVPILDEFKVVNTKLGQSIIGIGTLDDVIELLTLVLAAFLIGKTASSHLNFPLVIFALVTLFGLSYGLTRLKKDGRKFNFHGVEMLFLFVLFIFFLFIGIGVFADATAVAAILAGIALKTFIPNERLSTIESEVKTMCYGFFAPIFFIWVGLEMNMSYLFQYPLLILLVVAVSNSAKMIAGYVAGRNYLGTKQSILLGIGLSVRFSTSIIIIKLLFENGVIGAGLYSVIVASSIVFKFIVPVLFSNLLVRWGVARQVSH